VAFLLKDGEEKPIVRVIQCKRGKSPWMKDALALKDLTLPAIVKKEIWVRKDRKDIEKFTL